ncbi:MAG: protein phosphatase 2C domain-containing protein, partial [Paenisporosarcina sp.]
MEFTALSDIGQKRSVNEDRAAMFERPDAIRLGVVADGMGGHNAGDIASEMAILMLEKKFMEADVSHFLTVPAVQEWIIQSVKEINGEIYKHSLTHEDCQGMGTTLL